MIRVVRVHFVDSRFFFLFRTLPTSRSMHDNVHLYDLSFERLIVNKTGCLVSRFLASVSMLCSRAIIYAGIMNFSSFFISHRSSMNANIYSCVLFKCNECLFIKSMAVGHAGPRGHRALTSTRSPLFRLNNACAA